MRNQNIEVLLMHECDKYKPYYSSYIEGDLFLDQRGRIEDHLSICPPCRRAVQRLKLMCNTLRSLPILTTSPDFEYRLHQQITSLSDGHSLHLSLPIQNWKVPAFASIAVLGIIGLFMVFNSSDHRDIAVPVQQSITKPANPQKPTEVNVLSDKNIKGSSNKAAGTMLTDSLQRDSGRDYREEGMKLVDEK